jgi:prolipoprotein diacylglyceryl transferase
MRPDVADVLNGWFGTPAFSLLLPNYFIMLAIAQVAGATYAARRARLAGLDPSAIYGLALCALPCALIVGRVLPVLLEPASYRGVAVLLDPLADADNASYGGFLGGTAAAALYIRRRRLAVWRYLDAGILGVAIGDAITRIGCLLNGDDFGAISHAPLAIAYGPGSQAHDLHLSLGVIGPTAPSSLPVWPLQPFLAFTALAAAAAAAWWSHRGVRRDGETFLVYGILYSAGRFLLEFLRPMAEPPALTAYQVVTAAVLAVALAALVARRTRGRSRQPLARTSRPCIPA